MNDCSPLGSVRSSISLHQAPGPDGFPLVGNYFQVSLKQLHIDLENWADQYGPIYRISLGPSDIAVISDKQAILRVLQQRPQTFRRDHRLEEIATELQLKGVFVAEGNDWKRQRRIVIAALTRAKLSKFFPDLTTIVERLMLRWERAATHSQPINIGDDLIRFTVDVTMQIAFGVESNTLESSGPVIQQHLDRVFPKVHQRANFPFAYWRYFKLPSDRKLDQSLGEIRLKANQIIETTRNRLNENPERRKAPGNFLEALLVELEKERTLFSDAEIFANIGTLLLAGEDTTANTIAWAIYHFSKYPHYLTKVRDEIDSVLVNHRVIQSVEQSKQLPFLDAFRDESMRLKPVAPLMVMEAKDYVDILGISIPSGTPLILLTRYLATRQENFGEPHKFLPRRWLKSAAEEPLNHDSRASLPFGGGPRFCPGQKLALLQIRSVLTMLCRNFNFEMVDVKGSVEECLAFTMFPQNLFVRLSHRKQPNA